MTRFTWLELSALALGLVFVGQAASAAGAAGGWPALGCWLVMAAGLWWDAGRLARCRVERDEAVTWLRRERESVVADRLARVGGRHV